MLSVSEIKRKFFTQIQQASFKRIYTNQVSIGSGTQSQVYKALKDGCPVAIKYFRKQYVNNELIKYIQSQIQALNQIKHENILTLIDSYQVVYSKHYIKFCIVTQFCEQSLASHYLIQQLPDLKKLKICLQIVSAIKAAHQRNIMHRDIKPENILIKTIQQMNIKVADFGCSRNQSNTLQKTMFIGTPLYSAPNVQTANYSVKCDIYSVGLVIVYIFCGVHHFSGITDKRVLDTAQKKLFKDIRGQTQKFLQSFQLSSQIREFLVDIACFTLAQSQSQRYNSESLLSYIENQIQYFQQLQPIDSQIKSEPFSSQMNQNKVADFTKVKDQVKMMKKKRNQNHQFVQDVDLSKRGQALEKQQNNINLSSVENSLSYIHNESQRSTHQNSSKSSELSNSAPVNVKKNVNYKQDDENLMFMKQSQKTKPIIFSNLKVNSTILKGKGQKVQNEICQSQIRKKTIQQNYKKLNETQKLCSQMIRYSFQLTNKNEECKSTSKILSSLKRIKKNFQIIKRVQKITNNSFNFQQKQQLAFLFHYLYYFKLQELRIIVSGQGSSLEIQYGQLSKQTKDKVFVIVKEECSRIYPSMKKYSQDLLRKVNLIKPRLSDFIINILGDFQRPEYFSVQNCKEESIKSQINTFIEQRVNSLKDRQDIDILKDISRSSRKIIA